MAIFIATSEQTSEQRGINRDADRLGGIAAARQLYADRYKPAFVLYEQLCKPTESADVILNNDDLDRPQMRIRPDGRLSAGTNGHARTS